MNSNDAQMDVLLRRYAGKSPGNSATEHLDADELAAFAEGAIPEAARTRYVSHLVDCDNCRQMVSQLAIRSGAVLTPEATSAVEAAGYSWWKGLAGFLSPMTLRYAAFAMVLITVAGVVFLVTRRPSQTNLVVQNEQRESAPQSAVKPSGPSGDGTLPGQLNNNKALENRQMPLSQVSPTADQTAKLDQPRNEDGAASPPKPAKEGDVTSSPGLVASKKAEPAVTEPAPSYAPPPPVASERSQIQSSQQQQTQGGYASGPRKSGPADQFKTMDKVAPVREAGKDNISADDNSRLAANRAPASKRASDEKVKGPRRDLENNSISSNAVEGRGRNAQGIVSQSASTEVKPPETRSLSGRKFRREGNAWVDVKFKSSMPVKSISRGSSEFDELDSDLRSIAKQLGGQILVVRKNKAYLIK
jgi:hypothetical protein